MDIINPRENNNRSSMNTSLTIRNLLLSVVIISSSVICYADDIINPTPKMLATYSVVGVKKGDFLNMRSEPSSDSEVITKLKNGDVVQFIGKSVRNGQTEWVHVSSGVHNGWFNSAFLQESKATNHSPSTQQKTSTKKPLSQFLTNVASAIDKVAVAALDQQDSSNSSASTASPNSNQNYTRVNSSTITSKSELENNGIYLEDQGLRYINYFQTGSLSDGLFTAHKLQNMTGRTIRAFRASLFHENDFGEVSKAFNVEYISQAIAYKPIAQGEIFYVCAAPGMFCFYSESNPIGESSGGDAKGLFSKQDIKLFRFEVKQIAFKDD